MDAPFAPTSYRAHYSGTNYQLVGRLIEVVKGVSFAECVRDMIVQPLGLSDTEVLTRESDTLFASASPLFLGNQGYRGVQRMASLGAEGAIVSSVTDMLAFLRAWAAGKIVSAPLRAEMMMRFNPVFPGIGYGAGIMELTLPQNATVSGPRALYGHAGVTGHVMFHDPHIDAMIVLTTNQLTPSRVPYKALAQIIGVLDS
jgi:D-alanyl-D-alanine carboxypeptidase